MNFLFPSKIPSATFLTIGGARVEVLAGGVRMPAEVLRHLVDGDFFPSEVQDCLQHPTPRRRQRRRRGQRAGSIGVHHMGQPTSFIHSGL